MVELDKKLQVLAPTELTRELIWQHLSLTKHRQNPSVEERYKGADYEEVEQKWKAANCTFGTKRCTRASTAVDSVGGGACRASW